MQDLLECLCGLSYRGDVRVGIAEDRDKVRRIVKGSFEALQELYHPHTQVSIWKLDASAHPHGLQEMPGILRRLSSQLLGGICRGTLPCLLDFNMKEVINGCKTQLFHRKQCCWGACQW